MIEQITIVSVPVSDQDRAKDFYVNILGFELIADQTSDDGQRWVQVAPKGSTTSLTFVTWFPSMPSGSLAGLVVSTDDVHATYQELVAKGVEFEGPPAEQMGGTMTVFHDPDGNSLVLAQG